MKVLYELFFVCFVLACYQITNVESFVATKLLERTINRSDGILQEFAKFRDTLKNRTLEIIHPIPTINDLKAQAKSRKGKSKPIPKPTAKPTSKPKSKPITTTTPSSEKAPEDDIIDRDIDELNEAYNKTFMPNKTLENNATSRAFIWKKSEECLSEENSYSDDCLTTSSSSSSESESYGESYTEEDVSNYESSSSRSSSDEYPFYRGRPSLRKIQTDENDSKYHLNFETKFAFQNVDENGLKVRYNKTEHVIYGDADSYRSVHASNIEEPPAQNMLNGRCVYHNCHDNGYCQILSDCHTKCHPDYTKPFPTCCECQDHLSSENMPDRIKNNAIQFYKINTTIRTAVQRSDIEKCNSIEFEQGEHEKQLPDECLLCHKPLEGERFVTGCEHLDCNEYEEVDKTAQFPQCCSKCKTIENDNDKIIISPEYIDLAVIDIQDFIQPGSNSRMRQPENKKNVKNVPGVLILDYDYDYHKKQD